MSTVYVLIHKRLLINEYVYIVSFILQMLLGLMKKAQKMRNDQTGM